MMTASVHKNREQDERRQRAELGKRKYLFKVEYAGETD
jgi:hypothetical protein